VIFSRQSAARIRERRLRGASRLILGAAGVAGAIRFAKSGGECLRPQRSSAAHPTIVAPWYSCIGLQYAIMPLVSCECCALREVNGPRAYHKPPASTASTPGPRLPVGSVLHIVESIP